MQSKEIIAQLDDAEYQQNLLEAQADLRITEATLAEAASQLKLAEADFNRSKTLLQKEFISQTD